MLIYEEPQILLNYLATIVAYHRDRDKTLATIYFCYEMLLGDRQDHLRTCDPWQLLYSFL